MSFSERLNGSAQAVWVVSVLGVILCVLLVLNGCSQPSDSADAPDATQSESAAITTQPARYEKAETVYGLLSATGSPEELFVVNRFEVETPGVIEDEGTYKTVAPLTREVALEQKDSTITFQAQEEVFFYQGETTSLDLPWDFDFSYRLNGTEIDPSELAGKDGVVTIELAVRPQEQAPATFRDSFMLQITVTLDGNRWSDLSSSGATCAYAGTDITYTFTVLPGQTADLWLSGTADDCTISGIQVAGVPYEMVMEAPDFEESQEDLGLLSDALVTLDSGTTDLAAGAQELARGAQELASGSRSAQEGLVTLSSGMHQLREASGEIGQGLDQLTSGLNQADFSGLSSLTTLGTGLEQSAAGLRSLAEAARLAASGSQQALAAMDSAMAALGENTPDTQAIEALLARPDLTEGERTTIQQLAQTAAAAAQAKATWQAVRPGLAGSEELLERLGSDGATAGSLESIALGLEQAARGLKEGNIQEALVSLQQLQGALTTLAQSYDAFHGGLVSADEGLATVAQGNEQAVAGTQSLAAGTESLAQGANQLSGGTAALVEETADLPQLMADRIDEALADYEFPPFDGTSFASSEAGTVTSVQFVLRTPAIEPPAAPTAEDIEEPELTPWDRFLALFGF